MVDESPDVKEGLRVFSLVMYVIIFVIALPANVLLLLAVSRKAYRHYNTAKSFICLIQNLAVADILLVFFSIPFDLGWHQDQRFTFGPIMCRILWPLQTFSLQAIVLLYLGLMAHRMIGVMGNLYSQLKYSHTVWLSLFLWITAFATVIPYIIILKHDDLRLTCAESWPHFQHRQVYTVVLFLCQYGIPLLLMITMFIYVWSRLRKYKIMEPQRAKRRDRHHNVNSLLLAYIWVFAILLLPHQIMWFLLDFDNGENKPYFQSVLNVLYILTYSTAVANPVIFFLYQPEFKKDLNYFLKFQFICRQDNEPEDDLSDEFSEDDYDEIGKGAYMVDGNFNGKSDTEPYFSEGKSPSSLHSAGLSPWDKGSRYGSQNTLNSNTTPRTPGTPGASRFEMEKGLFTSTLDRCKSADKRLSDIRTSTSMVSRSRQSLGSESDNKSVPSDSKYPPPYDRKYAPRDNRYAPYDHAAVDLGYEHNRLSDEFL